MNEWYIVSNILILALINTALESPLGQVSMIPLLAWIAKNAPAHLKATFFAVFASFTNLALSASALGTKYLNEIFTVTREVKDKVSGEIQTTADYSELGILPPPSPENCRSRAGYSVVCEGYIDALLTLT